MHAFVPRSMDYTDVEGGVTAYNDGYHNATLGTTGIAVLFPPAASGAMISVSAGCYLGVRTSATLASFSDANYGSVLNGQPYCIGRGARGADSSVYIHVAPWTSTASVAIVFF